MRNAIGWTLVAAVGAFAFGSVTIPSAHAADMAVPEYGYQQQQSPPAYYPPPPQQVEIYTPPPPVAYDYPPPPPPPVAYYPYTPAPVVIGPYYGRSYYWHGYGPRFAYGYGHYGHYRRW